MSNLRIAELDFDTIKSNLKTFLQSQDEFTDYDFEGSSLSILLDILAYNTHYNAYLANMLVNEMFLDSAVKRSSAVSIAKHLGYTPRSARGATASIDVTVNNPTGLPPSLSLPRYTTFTSDINGTVFNFLTVTDYTASRSGSTYVFSDVEIKEGSYQEYRFAVSDNSPTKKYEIPAQNIDTTTLLVTVQNSATDTTTFTYNLTTDITGLDGESKVFYLEQNPFGRYEINFGDGILGKQLSVGNIILVRYLVSSGTGANVSNLYDQSFTAAAPIGGSSSVTVDVNSNSTGGANEETISEIKFNAPRVNSSKNRAVTSSDYESLLVAQVPEAEAVSVWGGEENDPPYYGRVLISLKPYEGFIISDNTKSIIINSLLKNKNVTTIYPVFVDPEYLYTRFTAGVTYNSRTTTLSSDGIKNLISTGINTFFNVNLNRFNKTFYASQLSKYLMELNSSILSVSLEVGLQVRIEPTLNSENNYTGTSSIKYYNKLHPNQFSSTAFYVNVSGSSTLVYLQDRASSNPPDYNGTGVIGMYSTSNDTLITNVGTINYGTGEVILNSITPQGYLPGQTSIQLSANLQEEYYNIATTRNQILVLDTSTSDPASRRLNGLTINVSSVV